MCAGFHTVNFVTMLISNNLHDATKYRVGKRSVGCTLWVHTGDSSSLLSGSDIANIQVIYPSDNSLYKQFLELEGPKRPHFPQHMLSSFFLIPLHFISLHDLKSGPFHLHFLQVGMWFLAIFSFSQYTMDVLGRSFYLKFISNSST